MEEAINQLLFEGYTSKEISDALKLIVAEAKKEEVIKGSSLDVYLDSLEDED